MFTCKKRALCTFVLSAFCVVNGVSFAAPNTIDYSPAGTASAVSGYLNQNLGKQLPLENPIKPANEPRQTTDKTPGDEKAQTFFLLKKVEFSGFKKLPYANLEQVAAQYENKEVSMSDIKQMTDSLVQLYAQNGYVVQVFAPPQDVVNGKLKLLITQANLGGVSFAPSDDEAPLDNSISSRVGKENLAAETIYSSVGQGSVIDLKKLNRALVILNDQQANKYYSAELKQGLAEGQTDVSIIQQQQPTVVGGIDFNNYGVKSTGRATGGAQVAVRDLLGLNETVSLGGIFSEGTDFGKIGYVMPIGVDGLKLSADFSALRYRTVGNATPANGNSVSESIQLSYPVFASDNGITKIFGGVSNRKFQNSSYDELVSSYSLKALTLGIAGNNLYGFIVPTNDVYSLSILQGSSYNSSSPANYQSIFTQQGNYQSYVPNSYTKFNGYYSKNFFVTDKVNFLLTFSGQVASNNLNSAESFYVSGPDGVRAYLPGTVYGTQGGMINSEISYKVCDPASVGAFFDIARVQQYKYPNNQIITSYTSPNVYSVSGAGLKASYNYNNTATASVYVAKATDGQNLPSLTSSGGNPNWVAGAQLKWTF